MQIYTIENLEIIELALQERVAFLAINAQTFSNAGFAISANDYRQKHDKTKALLKEIHAQNNRLKYQALRDTAKSK